MLRKILLIAMLITTFSCKSPTGQTEKTLLTTNELNGFFEQQGEGEIIEFNDSLAVFYNSSSFNCYPYGQIPKEDFSLYFPRAEVIDAHTFTNQEGFTILTYKRLATEPAICQELTEAQIYSNTYNFETLWSTFNDQYAFFEQRNIDWEAIKRKYKSQFTESTPPFEFYSLLRNMVQELKDDHSDFEVPDKFEEQWDQLNPEQDTMDYKNLAKDKILQNFVTNVRKYNSGQIAWGEIGDNIAYVQLNGMDGLADYQAVNGSEYWEKADESDDYEKDLLEGVHSVASKIINEMKDKDACIIDLRFNSGGFDWVGLAFMSHFIDKKYDVFKKKRRFQDAYSAYQVIDIEPSKPAYLKNVYLLTSPYTVSAAETTTMATLEFPNFSIVGAPTLGALSDMLYKSLPNGWVYSLSNEVYETMDGKLFEVIGIPPDDRIEYPREETALFKAMNLEFDTKDRAIEKVEERMK
ncbi:MAG: S41 family peptidase [Bacteroidota bacterium]